VDVLYLFSFLWWLLWAFLQLLNVETEKGGVCKRDGERGRMKEGVSDYVSKKRDVRLSP